MVRWIAPAFFTGALVIVSAPGCIGEDPGSPDDAGSDVAADTTAPNDGGGCTSSCPTEGATRCDGLKLQTCAKIGDCLAWSASTDCTTGNICCGTTCIPADNSNCYQCGTTCSGQTPACLPTPKKCGCTIAVCAATSQGCSPATGSCEACTALALGAKDFYVDASSFGGATGTANCPFRTITSALAAVSSRAATDAIIHVAAGTYDTTLGETFPLVLRAVSLVGAGSTKTTIKGVTSSDHAPSGGAFNEAYELTMLVGDAVGQTTIEGVAIQTTAVGITTKHVGVLCDRGNTPQSFTAAVAEGNTILRDVAVGPNYDIGVAVSTTTVGLSSGCNLTMLSSKVTGNGTGMWALGCGVGAGSVLAAVKVGDGTVAGGSTFKDNANATNTGGSGLLLWDCTHAARVFYNTFDGNFEGLHLEQNGKATKIFVKNNVISNSRRAGIILVRQPEISELIDNVIQGTVTSAAAPANLGELGAGLRYFAVGGQPYPTILKARNNRFVNNEIGLHFGGTPSSLPLSDFGSVSEAGGNDFACNSSAHTTIIAVGGDVVVETNGAVTFPFRSNTWDHGTPTTAAGSNGVDVLTLAGGFALDTTGSTVTTKTPTCAVTHVK